ncbi:hypothetical protein OH76DRAFT_506518 [Lentinus brumalis]|uniref:DUF6535 domain-containing protein n=1 Tax=Lentinus brumalis TaxID=2498619 RepID=A0A371DAY3_9APHY|nr:hypothetical protein OH76DRAFT_506518 [Polyporus brumalis]
MPSGTAADTTDTSPATAATGESRQPDSSAGGGATNSGSAQPEAQVRQPQETQRERPKWETADTLEEYWDARKTLFTEEQRTDAWNETANIVKTYSDELVDRWNKEMDNLLIYAGLFSAIQTAFNVELYKRLTPDPDPDPVLVALERISAQLSGFAVNAAFVNSTQNRFVLGDAKTPAAPVWVVVLNALWFSSLISSLAAASIAIMVKQWLTEYQSGLSGTSRQTARLRQLRLNSLQRWRVKEIVSFLPVLLQIASGLFFAGLLILLWNLNRTVAIVGTFFVAILLAFSLGTIILPSIATHCSYLSPPSRLLFELTRPWRKALYLSRRQLSSRIASHYDLKLYRCSDFDLSRFRDFSRTYPRIYRLCKMLYPRDAASTLALRGMESALVSQHTETLDGEMVAKAYTTSMNTKVLDHAALCTTELTLNATRACFQKILSANIAHWGKDRHQVPMRSVHPGMWSGALIALMDVSSTDAAWSPSTLGAALDTAYVYFYPWSPQNQADAPAARLACVDFARIIRHYDHSTLPPDSLNLALHIYIDQLPITIMYNTEEMNLGNDVRQFG